MTVNEKINIAALSQYISLNVIDKSGLSGGGEDLRLPRKLYTVRKSIERLYDLDPTNATLFGTSNMMLALCGKYQFIALAKQNAGGSIVPVSVSAGPNALDFIVSASTPIPTGGTTLYIPQFIGYNIIFARGGLVQYTTPQPGSAVYYSWSSATGYLHLLPDPDGAATEGESFHIQPIGVGTAITTPDIYPFVITSADFESDGVTYNNAAIVNDNLALYVNNFTSNVLFAPTDFTYTATGIIIITPGFDANLFNYSILVQKLN
jgi:hypothetical protein